MRILTAEGARKVDREAIDRVGIPALVLMENAAIGVVDAIGSLYPEVSAVAIFCGPGNNGGDGLAVGRHLATRGYAVDLFLVAPAGHDPDPQGDSARQAAICQRLGLDVERVSNLDELDAALARAAERELLVDALFGTGLSRALSGFFAAAVEGLNGLERPCLAIDLPSGLAGGSAEPLGPHVRADTTVTFVAPKVAQIFPPACDAVGELVIADLGVPPTLAECSGEDLHLLVDEELAELVPERAEDSHKGDFGHLLVVAGSVGKAGAAVLVARAAVRAGAGLVTVAAPEPLLAVLTAGSVESMTLPLPVSPSGQLAPEAVERVLAALAGKSALAIGPGLGQDSATATAIRAIVLGAELPAVVDADALNAFAGQAQALRGRRAPTILTPHPGELGRLLGQPTQEIQADRLGAARRAVEQTGAVVVLKGHLTVVAAPSPGGVHINPTGNPGMATGGTGDVLTGLLGALLAQGLRALDAARLGVFLHGLAGDLALAELGGHGLAAGDLIAAFAAAWAALLGEGGDGERSAGNDLRPGARARTPRLAHHCRVG